MITRADLTPRQIEIAELCIHEAGHAVAGVLLGGRLRAASVTGGLAGGQIEGRTTFDALPAGRDAEVAFAGVWAQACWRVDGRPTSRDVSAVLATTGCRDDTVLTAAGGVADGEITPLLTRCWPAVTALAVTLNAQPVVRHADVCEALGLSADPATAAVELAHIRAGSAPGSFTVTRPSVPA